MRNKLYRLWVGLLLATTLIPAARSWVQSSHQSIWLPGNILMDLKLGESRFNNATLDAFNTWNSQLQLVSFTSRISTGQQEDYKNDMYFAADYEGEDLGEGVLAVTFIYTFRTVSEINQLFETDIVFNTDYSWELYTGPPVSGTPDFRRVALHELGHVLGLGHPDENGQSVTAIMNAYISSTYTIQADDIAGGQNLYRSPGNTAAPANNNFASAYAISLSSGTTQATGENFYANKESGEPDHDPGEGSGGQSVWWKWTAPSNGDVTVHTQNSTFDTLLGVYTGGSVGSLSAVGVNDDDDAHEPSGYQYRYSRVDFTASAGTTYYFAVDGWDTEQGRVKLTLSFSPEITTVPPYIITHPANQTVTAGSTVSFTASAGGNPTPSPSWQRSTDGGNTWSPIANNYMYSGAYTNTLTITNAQAPFYGQYNDDQYRCVFTYPGTGSATTNPATLTVLTAPFFVAQPNNATINPGNSATFSVFASGRPQPTLQWQLWNASNSTWENLVNNSTYSGTNTQSLAVNNATLGMNGSQYRCVATNSQGATTSSTVTLTVRVPEPVTITSNPATPARNAGSDFTIAVTATGDAPLTYQWQGRAAGSETWANLSSGTPYSNVTNATLFINDAPLTLNGYSLRCVVSNGFSSATSDAVTLEILPVLPTINQQPTDYTAEDGASATFTVQASSTLTLSYQWQRLPDGSSTWENLTNTSPYSGATFATLNISAVSSGMDGDQFRVVISSIGGTTTSAEATLTVSPLAAIAQIALSDNTAYLLRFDGTLWQKSSSSSQVLPIATNVTAIDAGSGHLMFQKADQTLWTVGSNPAGQLGNGTTSSLTTPAMIAANVAAISAGGYDSIYLDTNGDLWTVGANYYATLIDGTTINRSSPAKVASGIRAVAAGNGFNLFIRSNGSLWGIGANNHRQIDPNSSDQTIARPVLISSNVLAISAGEHSTLYLTANHELWMLGKGLLSAWLVDTDVRFADAGYNHFVYLKSDGTLHGGGSNSFGEIGLPSGTSIGNDETVLIDSGVITAEAGYRTTIYTKNDGTTYELGAHLLGPSNPSRSYSPSLRHTGVTPIANSVSSANASTADFGRVRLTWSPITGVSGYKIYRSTTSDFEEAQLIQLVGLVSVTYDTNVTAGVIYHYWIVTVNPNGDSPPYAVTGSAAATSGPVITSLSDSLSTAYGSDFSLTVTATGEPAPSYQWQRLNSDSNEWQDLNVGTQYTHTFSNTLNVQSAKEGGQFRVRAYNDDEEVISDPIDVTVVNGPLGPVITSQPSSTTVNSGATATFHVGVTGSSLVYEWQVNNPSSSIWGRVGNLEIFNPGPQPPITYTGMNSATLTINTTLSHSGLQYRCKISNSHGVVYTTPRTLTVLPPIPVFTTHPQSMVAQLGATIELSASVSDNTAVVFQWQREGVNISGANASTYTISSLQSANSGAYRLLATNAGGTATSNTAEIALAQPPLIITQPVSQTVYTGQPATFTVTATSNTAISYQWRFEGEDIPDATSPSYSISSAQAANTGSYTVVVSTIAGTRTSNPAVLTVNAASLPAFTLQPENLSTVIGRPAVFTVSATGSPSPTYQWQVKRFGDDTWYNTGNGGGSYSGSATDSLSVTSEVASQGDQYRCVATNLAGTATSNAATLTVGLAGFTKISAGRYHSARISTDSKAYAVGFNPEGQLGNGTTTNIVSPQQMALNGRLAADVAAGAQHTLILATDKSLWATGLNSSGQLGDGTTTAKSSPVLLANDVAAFAAGLAHSVYIKTDGTLWTVGGNDSGQLGNGSTTDSSTAAQVATDVIEVSAGLRQTLFLKSDGTLWGMGDMNGSGTPVTTPVQIATDVKTMAAGGYHSLFVKADGTLWTMGYNPFGQLGNGTTTSNTPVQITTGVRSVAAGYFHSLFIKTDGSLWAMGYNSGGQLGDDTNTNRSTPIQVTTNVTSASGSESYTLFTKTDGTLWGTGYNAYGQFGNGLTVTTTWPNQIDAGAILNPVAPTGVDAVASSPYDRVRLTWAPDGNASGYEVWRSTTNDPVTATRIASDLPWAMFVDQSTSLNQSYYYWIKAVNVTGSSSFSSTASATTGSTLNQTITFTGPADQSFSVSPINLSATASSGLPVTFTLVSGPATLSGNELTLTGTGMITVRASQAGNASYSAAVDVERTFTVSAANATIALDGLSVTYDGTPHAVTATTTPAGLTVNFTYDGEAGAPTDAGSYAVVATIDDPDHQGSANDTLIIAKAAQTITFSSLADRAYTTSPITLSATASSGLTVTFAVQSGPATLDGNELTLTGTGSVTVRASQAGNSNYLAAVSVDRSFAVTANTLSWLEQQFTPTELADESISGPTADPDRDGLTNLLEYALGLDPKDVDTSGLPEAASSATDWTYTYNRPADRPDLTYEVEYSTDLSTWSTAGITHTMTADNGSTQTWQATLPLASASDVFFRLKITQN